MMCLVTNRQTLAAIAIRGEHSYTKDKSGLNFKATLWVLLLFFFLKTLAWRVLVSVCLTE